MWMNEGASECVCVFALDGTLDDVCVCRAQTSCEVTRVCAPFVRIREKMCVGVDSVRGGAWFMSAHIFLNLSLCASVSCH